MTTRERIDAILLGAREHNRKAKAAVRTAEEAVQAAFDAGITPEGDDFRGVMVACMPQLEAFVAERTLAKVTFVLAHTAERWLTTPADSLAEAVYTASEAMFDSGFEVRDCRADTPERIAALALSGVEHFNPEADTLDPSITLDALLVAGEGAAADHWKRAPAMDGWALRMDLNAITGRCRFTFDPEHEPSRDEMDGLPPGSVYLHEIDPDELDDNDDV